MRESVSQVVLLCGRTAAHTDQPNVSACSTIKLPMKPLAPVMRIFICLMDSFF